MKSVLILSATLAVALPALAQDTVADWDVTRDPDRKLTVAFTAFDKSRETTMSVPSLPPSFNEPSFMPVSPD